MKRQRPKYENLGYRFVGPTTILALLILWFLLTPELIPELIFPSPEAVWAAIDTLGLDLVQHAGITLIRVMGGWLVGILIGISFGLLMSWSKIVFAVSNPLIETLRPLPPIALIPFFIIWFGIGSSGQIILIALGSFMVLVVNTFVSVTNLSPRYVHAAISLGASKLQVYRTVILPAILPPLVAGFRVAAALSFGIGVAAEFMGAQSGLGFLIMVARRTLNTNTILLGTLIIGLESFLIDKGIRVMARYMCRWTEKSTSTLNHLSNRI